MLPLKSHTKSGAVCHQKHTDLTLCLNAHLSPKSASHFSGCALSFPSRNRIIACASPRTAATDTLNTQPRTSDGSVCYQGFGHIFGAGGPKAARLTDIRRQCELVSPQGRAHGTFIKSGHTQPNEEKAERRQPPRQAPSSHILKRHSRCLASGERGQCGFKLFQ